MTVGTVQTVTRKNVEMTLRVSMTQSQRNSTVTDLFKSAQKRGYLVSRVECYMAQGMNAEKALDMAVNDWEQVEQIGQMVDKYLNGECTND